MDLFSLDLLRKTRTERKPSTWSASSQKTLSCELCSASTLSKRKARFPIEMVSPLHSSDRASPAFLSRADIGRTRTRTRTEDTSRRSLPPGVGGATAARPSCCSSSGSPLAASRSSNDSAAGLAASAAAERGDEASALAADELTVRSPAAARRGVPSPPGDDFGRGRTFPTGLSARPGALGAGEAAAGAPGMPRSTLCAPSEPSQQKASTVT